jgi:hypothetical protein
VIKFLRSLTPNPLLPKVRLSENVAKSGLTLIQDLLAMRNKKETARWKVLAQSLVIKSRHNGLARTSGRDQQVSVMATRAGER